MKEKVILKIDDYYHLADRIFKVKKDSYIIPTSTFGFSMYPTILPNEQIVIDGSQGRNFSEGDIIAFISGSLLVCHRIIGVKERDGQRFFVTKGDSKKFPDSGEIGHEQIAGKIVSVIRGKRHIDPYNYNPSFLERRVIEVKMRLLSTYWLFKRMINRILIHLQLNFIYENIIGELLFRILKRRIKYYFLLPRNNAKDFLAYRYIDILLEDIIDKDQSFFRSLDNIGGFKIAANIKGTKIAIVEIIKCMDKDKGGGFWAIADFRIKALCRATGIENEILQLCSYILSLLNVNELYFLSAKREKISRVYLKRWDAQFIHRFNTEELYLLPTKLLTPLEVWYRKNYLKCL